MSAAVERSRRATAGKRMGTLVGKAQEDDEAFWGHDTWADDPDDSDNGSFRSSDEDSEAKKDQFDSDFNDSETDEDEAADAEDGAAQDKLIEQEDKRSKKRMHVDISKAGRDLMGKKKVKGKNIAMGEGLNAGIVLNFPGAVPFAPAFHKAPAVLGTASLVGLPIAPPPAAAGVATQQIPPVVAPVPVAALPKKPAASRRTTRSHRRTLRHTTKQAGEESKKAATQKEKEAARAAEKAQVTKSKHKRLYTQGELLLEAVHETEPENERWLLGRKRILDKVEQDKERQLHQQGLQGTKTIERFHSRRGYLNTINFPDMDHVPAILTMQPKVVPPPPRLCVITGLKARYRCPLTLLGYYDLKAFRELRRRLKAGEPLNQREPTKQQHDKTAETNGADVGASRMTTYESATTSSSSPSHTKPAKSISSPDNSRKRSKQATSPKEKPVVAKSSNNSKPANESTVGTDTSAPPADSLADVKDKRSPTKAASAKSVTAVVKVDARPAGQLPVKAASTKASSPRASPAKSVSKQSNSKKQQSQRKASNDNQQEEDMPTVSTAQLTPAAEAGTETKQAQVTALGQNANVPQAASATASDVISYSSQASSPLQSPPSTAGVSAPRQSPKSSPTALQPAAPATHPTASTINPDITSAPLHHQYPVYTHPYVHPGAAYSSYPYHLQYPPAHAYHHHHPSQVQAHHPPASTYAPYGYPVYSHLHPGVHGHPLAYQTPTPGTSNTIAAGVVMPVATAAAVLAAATTVLAASLAMPAVASTVANLAVSTTVIAPTAELPRTAEETTVLTPATSVVAPSVASVVAPAAAEAPPPPPVSSPQRKSPRKRKPTERALQAQLALGAPHMPPFPDGKSDANER